MNSEAQLTVVSVRGRKPGQSQQLIYIGRRGRVWPQSPLHNPFKLDSEAERAEVIEKYRRYLWGKIQANDTQVTGELARIAAILRDGKSVQLGCWCSPLPCHGDVVKAAVLWWCKNR